MFMDERVNCMSCLVSDEVGMEIGAVAMINGVTHAVARSASGLFFPLCAFDASGTLRPGTYWRYQISEDRLERR